MVRSDQTLLFSPISVLYWTDAIFDTEAKLRADTANVLGVVSNLSVTVDGAPALLPAGVTSLQQFRQSSPLFPLHVIEGNIFSAVPGVFPGVFPAIVEGYTMALQALPVGNHPLRFTALMSSVGPYVGTSLAQDITYNITAVPEVSTWAMMGLGLGLGLGLLAVATARPRRRRAR